MLLQCREIDTISAILTHDVQHLLKRVAAAAEEDAELFGGPELQQRIARETALRVANLGHYLAGLRGALQSDQIPRAAVDYGRLVDAFLLGTASERISGKCVPLGLHAAVFCAIDGIIVLAIY